MAQKRHKYRFAMLDDRTLHEVFHFRVSLLGAISVITLSILGLILLLSVLIVYTPIRNILPGYSASLREQLIVESARVDSLQTDLQLQRQYLNVIKQLTAGDIETDSVQSLDSLQRVERARLVAERNEVVETFKAQYEQKEHDRMSLYENIPTPTLRQLYRPVKGVVIQSARSDLHLYGSTVRTAKNENVVATTRGTVTMVERMADNTFTVVLQSGSFITIYRQLNRVLKSQGAMVERGEVIGMMDGENDLVIELWDAGQTVNPEEVIVW